MEASYVDLADPTHLEFDYLRWIRIVLDVAGATACCTSAAVPARWRGRWPRQEPERPSGGLRGRP